MLRRWTHIVSEHLTSSYWPITWSDCTGCHWIHVLVTSCSHWRYFEHLWLYTLFKFCETLRFSRIMQNCMLLYYSDLFSYRKCLTADLAYTFTRSFTSRKRQVNGCRVIGLSPYASLYFWWIMTFCWSCIGSWLHAIQSWPVRAIQWAERT